MRKMNVKVPLHERNIDDLFQRAGQRIGEGLELYYWQAHYGPEDLHRSKLELFLILQNQQAWENLEKACEARIHALFSQNRQAIQGLKSSEREQYNRVRELAKTPEALEFAPPAEITVKVRSEAFAAYDKHLCTDELGEYQAELTTWEVATI